MRTSPLRTSLVALVAVVVFAACESAIGVQQATSTTDGPAVGIFASSDGLPDKVTGSGHYVDDVQGTQDGWRNFGFNVKMKSDGSVTGQMQLNNRSIESVIHGVITCVSFDGDRAWMGGTYTNAQPPFEAFEGTEFGFFVIDNGQGSGDPPDVMSNTLPLSSVTAQDYCDLQPNAPGLFFDIESGNITIH